MFKYYSSYALVISGFTHLFCCGIPIIFGLTTILTNIVFFESLAFDFELFGVVEIYLFVITTTLFLIIIAMEIYSKKIRKFDNVNCCAEEESDLTKKKIKFNIILSSILYILNSSLFLSEVLN